MTNSTSTGPTTVDDWIYRNHVAAFMMLLFLAVLVGTLTTKGLQHARVKPERDIANSQSSTGSVAVRREIVDCPLVTGPSVLPTPGEPETKAVEIIPRARS